MHNDYFTIRELLENGIITPSSERQLRLSEAFNL